jgi:hypothetical protein
MDQFQLMNAAATGVLVSGWTLPLLEYFCHLPDPNTHNNNISGIALISIAGSKANKKKGKKRKTQAQHLDFLLSLSLSLSISLALNQKKNGIGDTKNILQ